MRHKVQGRKLGRNTAHRRALFRNMARSLILSVRPDEEDPNKPKVRGRIVTTLPKAKELRRHVEKLITLAKKALPHQRQAEQYATNARRYSDEWQRWRQSEQWQKWAQANAPALAYRRRAFAILRDNEAVDILFSELAERFEDRPGGYTRVVRLPRRRLGDAGQLALIEFVGERDRIRRERRKAPRVVEPEPAESEQATDEAAEQAEAEPTAETQESAEAAAAEAQSAPEAESGKEPSRDQG